MNADAVIASSDEKDATPFGHKKQLAHSACTRDKCRLSLLERLQKNEQRIKIMEVCGTHTSAIAKAGIKSMLTPSIRLVSGPGCPVCVTPPSVIDGLIRYALDDNCTVLSFGDMFKVSGTNGTLANAKAEGAHLRLMYSPFDAIPLAKENPKRLFVIAAVGFETTAPVYAALLETLIKEKIYNIKLYTALKTMPEILSYICENESVDAFICPGHVSVIIGENAYRELWQKYHKPFVIAGFEPEHILSAIYEILLQTESGKPQIKNLYSGVVTKNGQEKAQSLIDRYFAKTSSMWRGIGSIKNSGYELKPEYSRFSADINQVVQPEAKINPACRCTDVILGRIEPDGCSLFGGGCTPQNPAGACMVSQEGACGIAFLNRKAVKS